MSSVHLACCRGQDLNRKLTEVTVQRFYAILANSMATEATCFVLTLSKLIDERRKTFSKTFLS